MKASEKLNESFMPKTSLLNSQTHYFALYLGNNPLMLLVVMMGAIRSSSIIISVSSSPVYDDDDFVGD